ncbi:MAG: hypothetical protein ACK5Y2_11025 [Bdellovibrionales bacterium]
MIGAQLQEIETHAKGIALGLYKKGRIWWILDLSPQEPVSLLFENESPWRHKIAPKPVALFLNSHAKNLYLSKFEKDPEDPRILHVEWVGTGRVVRMEVRLIPKSPNIIVEAGEKSLSWAKPKGLPPLEQVPKMQEDPEALKARWLEKQNLRTATGATDWQQQRQKNITKKKRALDEIHLQLNSGELEKWRTLGELLKSFEPQELGQEWASFLKGGGDRAKLMQNAFEKAKQLKRKRSGTLERIEILKKEIAALEAQTEPVSRPLQPSAKPREPLKEVGAEGRTRRFGDFVASRGKNAKDNLALLRGARAWDLWIHLRDYPSSHVILSVPKGQSVPDSILREAAVWLARETSQTKAFPSGTRLEILVAECRFVRPIKGDKLGRVNYQNERVLSVVIP